MYMHYVRQHVLVFLIFVIIDLLFFVFIVLFYLQVQQLIAELNEILAHDIVDDAGLWKEKLSSQSLQLFDFLPSAIQEQLMLERDPHGNVQVILYPTISICVHLSWFVILGGL